MEQYHQLDLPAAGQFASYDAMGDFLGFGHNDNYEADPDLRWDAAGAPLVEYGGAYYRNPVTAAQYALTLYGRTLRGLADNSRFLAAVDVLLTMQDSRGAFPAPYPFPYYRTGEVLDPGWVSGMAQGQALSVLRRAYGLTGDARYRAAGDAALEFLLTGPQDGGPMNTLGRLDPGLQRFITFEEFATAEPHYTLNGFVFTLLGLYDWSTIDRAPGDTTSGIAARLFDCGLATALYTLPYYDVGGFSAYDLGHILTEGPPNVQPEYHAIHLDLLGALYEISGEPGLLQWLTEWSRAVDPG